MILPILAMAGSGRWQRETAVAVLILLAVATLFLQATSSGGRAERSRRAKFARLAFFGSPLLAAIIAGLGQAFGDVSPLDVGHHYSSIIVIGVIVGSILGLFFAATSLLCSNGPESPPRNPNP